MLQIKMSTVKSVLLTVICTLLSGVASAQLNKSQIKTVIQQSAERLNGCYERALEKDKSLQGKVIVSFEIEESGAVTHAEIQESSIQSDQLKQCVITAFKAMVFPRVNPKTRVSYPLIFREHNVALSSDHGTDSASDTGEGQAGYHEEKRSADSARNQKPNAPCASSAGGCPDVAWVTVKGGSFMMGSNDGDDYEKPVHQVRVSDFRIAESEVTVRQYRKCVEAGVCTEPTTGGKCTWGKSGYDDHPVNCVDWGQARTFSRWAGGDLPTEAQWEYAARGGQGFKYAGSDDASAVGWFGGSSTHPVKRKWKNGYGLYDMSGNVWEWTLDEWHDSYSGAPNNGDQPWGSTPTCSTRCDKGSSRRVIRGGGWLSAARYLRVADRYGLTPDYRDYDLGFRPAGPIP